MSGTSRFGFTVGLAALPAPIVLVLHLVGRSSRDCYNGAGVVAFLVISAVLWWAFIASPKVPRERVSELGGRFYAWQYVWIMVPLLVNGIAKDHIDRPWYLAAAGWSLAALVLVQGVRFALRPARPQDAAGAEVRGIDLGDES